MTHKKVFAEWNDRYITNVDFVDTQHRRLIEIMNELYDGLNNRRFERKEVFRKAAIAAINYVKIHFSEEEKWMTETNYPHIARQHAEHDKFVKRLLRDTEKFDDDNQQSAFHFASFLRDWLLHHIAIEDTEFRFHLQKIRSNPPPPDIPHSES